MKPYQQRVIDEKAALGGKIEALAAFIGTHQERSLDTGERSRLGRQLRAMREYSNILEERIDHFAP